ncbi:MAG: glycosyltransferase [Erythrobacter sp.]
MPETDSTNASRSQAVCGALAYLATILALTILSRELAPSVLTYVSVLTIGSAMSSALLWRSAQIKPVILLAIAIIGHGIALFGETVFEDDYYRFIWDGWRVLETGTPYGISPADFVGDENIPPAMQGVLEWINYPQYPTIYGPVLQIIFAFTSLFSGTDELGLRIVFACASILLGALLLRKYRADRVALFAWNPLVVAESTLHLHADIFVGLMIFAAVLAGRRHPVWAGCLLAFAAGVKLVALAAWPILLRLRPRALFSAIGTLLLLYGVFVFQGHGAGLDSTQTFATTWHFNPIAYLPLFLVLGPTWGRLTALAIAGLIVFWLHARSRSFEEVPLAAIFGVILLFAPAVNTWYLMWLLPLAVGRKEVWPYVASAALPLSYLTGLNLEDFTLNEFEVHPVAQYAQWTLIGTAILYDLWRQKMARRRVKASTRDAIEPRVSVIIPALNEESSVGDAVRGILGANPGGFVEIIVADNGSTDRTSLVAKQAGAILVSQPERGYGAACLAGLAVADQSSNIILFMDADLSDVPEDAAGLIAPIAAGEADMVIGSRVLGQIEPGAMSMPQRFGNWLAPALVRLIWGVRYTDLGPFRSIRRDALEKLQMTDRDFGWTIEMQVRAAKMNMKICERPTHYRRRVGISKISGTIGGVLAAGCKILYVIAREAFGDFDKASRNAWLGRRPSE